MVSLAVALGEETEKRSMATIGIDIGGMSAKLALMEHQEILSEAVMETGAGLSYETFLAGLVKEVKKLMELAQTEKVDKIGISSCGLIDSRRGMIVYSNNLPWENRELAKELSAAVGVL